MLLCMWDIESTVRQVSWQALCKLPTVEWCFAQLRHMPRDLVRTCGCWDWVSRLTTEHVWEPFDRNVVCLMYLSRVVAISHISGLNFSWRCLQSAQRCFTFGLKTGYLLSIVHHLYLGLQACCWQTAILHLWERHAAGDLLPGMLTIRLRSVSLILVDSLTFQGWLLEGIRVSWLQMTTTRSG